MTEGPRAISQRINTERLHVYVVDSAINPDTTYDHYLYRAWIGERPTVSGYGQYVADAVADLFAHLRRNEVSYAPAEPAPSIRVFDGEDFRFHRAEFFRVAPVSGVVEGSGVRVTQDDGTYIGFIAGRTLLNLARGRAT